MTVGLLGDTPARDYSRKLELFNALAEPEMRLAIDSLGLIPGMRVLDAGCGTGSALPWLSAAVAPAGMVWGIDLSAVHAAAARRHASASIEVAQGDIADWRPAAADFDCVWSVNTVNHLRDPVGAVRHLTTLLAEGGCVALGQSSFVPDMVFAWDSRLERAVDAAVRRYYLDRYRLDERDLTSIRGLVGLLQRSGLSRVRARSHVIERLAPLTPPARAYLGEAIFENTWGAKLSPYLSSADQAELADLCDAGSPRYALDRPDFHFLQTFTVAVGVLGASSR